MPRGPHYLFAPQRQLISVVVRRRAEMARPEPLDGDAAVMRHTSHTVISTEIPTMLFSMMEKRPARCGASALLPVTLSRAALLLALVSAACTDERRQATITDPRSLKTVAPVGDSIAPLYAMNHPKRIKGRYIVRFRPGVSDVQTLSKSLTAEQHGRVYQVLGGLKAFWGELPDAAVEALRHNRQVAYIEADVAMSVNGYTTQSSPRWPLDRVDQNALPLNGTYQYSVNGSGVHIWIIDTGVDRNEPDLAGRVDESWSVTNNGKDPYAPCEDHGTLVARVAAGLINGVAKGATIHSARVDDNCSGDIRTGAASTAFEFIGNYSPRPAVANFSSGHNCSWYGCGPTVDDAAKYARNHGVTVVVSAGNDGIDACNVAPAHTGELITVAASNSTDQRIDIPGWWASNYGSCVDLFAPVEDAGGTSLAAPMVTGVAALHLQLFPSAAPADVEYEIYRKATPGVLGNIGSGSPNRLLYAKTTQPYLDIPGPSLVSAYATCTWTVVVTGGQPPYQYVWYRNGSTVVSTSSSYSVAPAGASDFTLDAYVTDALGRTNSASKSITIDPSTISFLCS
jgi:aqualysin 1